MEKTYQILLTVNVPRPSMNSQGLYTNDELTIKETIYSYLEELIEDDTLYFKEIKKCKSI